MSTRLLTRAGGVAVAVVAADLLEWWVRGRTRKPLRHDLVHDPVDAQMAFLPQPLFGGWFRWAQLFNARCRTKKSCLM